MLKFDPITGQFIDDAQEPTYRLLSGEGEPIDTLGSIGDYYIETESLELYCKTEAGWGEGIPLVGEQGVSGKDGLPGAMGAPGRDGVDGSHGKDGIDGLDGVNGKPGRDGREVELQASATHFQWRHLCWRPYYGGVVN